MITTTAVTTTTTITTTAVGAQMVGVGVFAIIVLIVLLILRDISMVKLESEKANNKKHPFLSSFVKSSNVFIIPLVYVFLSIILYKIILII